MMKKKYIKLIKIFLAIIMVFSQLSNAIVVFADEVGNTDEEDIANVIGNDNTQDSDDLDDQSVEENLDDEGEYDEGEETISPTEGEEPTEGENNTEEDNLADSNSEEHFTLDNLKEMLNAYLNKSELSDDIINLLIEKGAPSTLNGEFTEVSFDDIMFVNELLKENSDTENEREDNSNLKLSLGDTPLEVTIGDTFDVNILISNEELEEYKDESIEEVVEESNEIKEFIDGIEGIVTTNDNLKLINISFNNFEGIFSEDGKFVSCGSEYSEDNGIILTLTFEAINDGTGEVTISGKTAKYLNIDSFEDLKFSTTIMPMEEEGLISIISDVGEFDKEFDKDSFEYTLTVPAGTETVTLSGALASNLSNVTGLSSYTLDGDKTEVLVTVTNSDGTITTYTINIIREVKEVEQVEEMSVVSDTPVVAPVVYYVYSSNNYLKSLNIKDYDIIFNRDTLEYKIKVREDIKSLEITAIPDDYRSRVEISGNEKFENGENIVTIKVTAENGSVREYKLVVDKAIKEIKNEENNSNRVEKIIIIILIILVVLGLLYLIFKKDDDGNTKENINKASNDSKLNNNRVNNNREDERIKNNHNKKNKKER